MNQCERIVEYLEKFGSITQAEAWEWLRISKLSTRISEMIRDGIAFDKKLEVGKDRFGKRVTYMRYSLRD